MADVHPAAGQELEVLGQAHWEGKIRGKSKNLEHQSLEKGGHFSEEVMFDLGLIR